MKQYSAAWFAHHLKNNRAAQWLAGARSLHLMALKRENQQPVSDLPFKVDARDDLERFEETESWHDRDQFLAEAGRRLDSGIHCVTLVQDGQLAFIDWVNPTTAQSRFGYLGQTVIYPARTATQFSAYVHPAHRRRGLFVEGLRYVDAFVFKEMESRLAIAAVHSDNAPAVLGHLQVGFETVALLETRRLLGRARYSAHQCSPYLALRPEPGQAGTWRLEFRVGS